MPHPAEHATVGVLFSGGLDSAILVGRLAASGRKVVPLFIRSGLVWQDEELRAARRFLDALGTPVKDDLVVLEVPLDDLYANHWSRTGDDVPDAASPDEAVYLPGRNALLIIKAAVWCQLHGIGELALGVLGTSPFDDARSVFFEHLEAALNAAPASSLRLTRPLGEMDKKQVIQLGRELPLRHTFSCLSPVGSMHCGACNKCAERREAFRAAGLDDPTPYAAASAAVER
ncbi:MAG TPA: 7-cyano-7-deazaguanine synthase [Planctomycetaceae bacterium]|nr:7-cyano-7-deazaguanine synthase [Planctomycetaceae bacterium]